MDNTWRVSVEMNISEKKKKKEKYKEQKKELNETENK